jgi:hypothetical protein
MDYQTQDRIDNALLRRVGTRRIANGVELAMDFFNVEFTDFDGARAEGPRCYYVAANVGRFRFAHHHHFSRGEGWDAAERCLRLYRAIARSGRLSLEHLQRSPHWELVDDAWGAV